jgi:hypothetical protein
MLIGGGRGARHEKESDMAMQQKVLIVLALSLLPVAVVTGTADGQIPTAADAAGCNQEAPQAVKAGSVSPIKDDHVRADRARGSAGVTTSSADLAGKHIESPDPQIHGMEAEAAKNATYQAAYRTCMRRKGF